MLSKCRVFFGTHHDPSSSLLSAFSIARMFYIGEGVPLQFIGGVDLSFVKDDNVNACAALVIVEYPSLKVSLFPSPFQSSPLATLLVFSNGEFGKHGMEYPVAGLEYWTATLCNSGWPDMSVNSWPRSNGAPGVGGGGGGWGGGMGWCLKKGHAFEVYAFTHAKLRGAQRSGPE